MIENNFKLISTNFPTRQDVFQCMTCDKRVLRSDRPTHNCDANIRNNGDEFITDVLPLISEVVADFTNSSLDDNTSYSATIGGGGDFGGSGSTGDW